jgi:KUP system potassium uptake protein
MSSSQTPHAAAPGGHGHAPSAGGLALVIGAIGVVFGDIGTSPLYTLKEAFSPHYGLNSDHDTVLGAEPGGDAEVRHHHHARRQ